MEKLVMEAMNDCASRFAVLSVVFRLGGGKDGGAYLMRDAQGSNFVLKLAVGMRRDMLVSEWHALKTLHELAPGCAPVPVMYAQGDEYAWLLREYIPGQTLYEWREAGSNIPTREAVKAALALTRLLNRIHEAGLILRDIKPENLVRMPNGRWVMIDAGTARAPTPGKEHDTELYATRGFAAPEQYGFRQSDQRVDVYALGVTLCFLFTGRIDTDALKPRGIPYRIRRIIRKCVAFAPEKRFSDMTAVQKALIGRRERIAARAALALALFTCVALFLWPLLSPTLPEADSYESLIRLMQSYPDGSDATIRINGNIEATDTLPIWKSRFTFVGDGSIVGAHSTRAVIRIHPQSELVLTDGITVENANEGECIAIMGGTLVMRGGTLRRNPASTDKDVAPCIYVMENGRADIRDGEICIRRDQGAAIGVNVSGGEVNLMGGRLDVMGDSCIGVLLGNDSLFSMSGGFINGIARSETGYAVQNQDFASIRYTAGEMLVNGIMSVPLEQSWIGVSNYDELVQAIASDQYSSVVVMGEIYVPEYIRINGNRDISIVGRDENARLTGNRNGPLFIIDTDSRLHIRNLSLIGNASFDNSGTLHMYGINLQLSDSNYFILNHGVVEVLYGNQAILGNAQFLLNRVGARATITATITCNDKYAFDNEGTLSLLDCEIDLTAEGAIGVQNSADAQCEETRVVYKRNGIAVENASYAQ